MPLITMGGKTREDERVWIDENYTMAGVVTRPRLHFLPKSCFEGHSGFKEERQLVALAPWNDFTKYMHE